MPQGMWVAGGEERRNVAVAAVQEEETGKEINLIITVNKLLLLLYGKIMNHELSLVFVIDKCRAMHFVNSKTTEEAIAIHVKLNVKTQNLDQFPLVHTTTTARLEKLP